MSEQYKLPNGWRWVKLGEVCEIFSGSPAPQDLKYFTNGRYPFIRVSDLGKYCRTDNLLENKDFLNDLAIKELSLNKAEKGTIIFPKSGAAIMTNNRAILGKDAFIVSHLAALKTKKGISETYFVYYWLCLIDMIDYLENPGYPSLKLSTISKILIPLPPLDEQQRIAGKIEKMMEEINQAKEACEKQLEAAQSISTAYLRETFESPESKTWERKKLGEILETIESGKRPKGGVSNIKEGIPSIGAEHLNSFAGFNLNNIRYIPVDFYEKMNKGKIKQQDVLVVKDGATTGKVSFVDDKFPFKHAAVNEHVFILRTKAFIKQEFLFWFLSSPFGQAQIQKEFHGAAQGGINQQFIDNIEIPVPGIEIQIKIIDNLKSKINALENLKVAISNQLSTINALPQAILSRAFKGEL